MVLFAHLSLLVLLSSETNLLIVLLVSQFKCNCLDLR